MRKIRCDEGQLQNERSLSTMNWKSEKISKEDRETKAIYFKLLLCSFLIIFKEFEFERSANLPEKWFSEIFSFLVDLFGEGKISKYLLHRLLTIFRGMKHLLSYHKNLLHNIFSVSAMIWLRASEKHLNENSWNFLTKRVN